MISSQYRMPVSILVFCTRWGNIDYTVLHHCVKLCMALLPLWLSVLITQRKKEIELFWTQTSNSSRRVRDGKEKEAPGQKSLLLQSAHIKEWVQALVRADAQNWTDRATWKTRRRAAETCRVKTTSATSYLFQQHTHSPSHTYNNTQRLW